MAKELKLATAEEVAKTLNEVIVANAEKLAAGDADPAVVKTFKELQDPDFGWRGKGCGGKKTASEVLTKLGIHLAKNNWPPQG